MNAAGPAQPAAAQGGNGARLSTGSGHTERAPLKPRGRARAVNERAISGIGCADLTERLPLSPRRQCSQMCVMGSTNNPRCPVAGKYCGIIFIFFHGQINSPFATRPVQSIREKGDCRRRRVPSKPNQASFLLEAK